MNDAKNANIQEEQITLCLHYDLMTEDQYNNISTSEDSFSEQSVSYGDTYSFTQLIIGSYYLVLN
jgi:vancomycin resistance protein YoaR